VQIDVSSGTWPKPGAEIDQHVVGLGLRSRQQRQDVPRGRGLIRDHLLGQDGNVSLRLRQLQHAVQQFVAPVVNVATNFLVRNLIQAAG